MWNPITARHCIQGKLNPFLRTVHNRCLFFQQLQLDVQPYQAVSRPPAAPAPPLSRVSAELPQPGLPSQTCHGSSRQSEVPDTRPRVGGVPLAQSFVSGSGSWIFDCHRADINSGFYETAREALEQHQNLNLNLHKKKFWAPIGKKGLTEPAPEHYGEGRFVKKRTSCMYKKTFLF